MTNLNPASRDLLFHMEGFRSAPYHDNAKGVPTIGIGCTYYPGGKPVTMADAPITIGQAWTYVEEIGMPILNLLQKGQPLLNANQVGALFSFTWNEGVGALEGSHLFQLVKQDPNDPGIKAEFAKWVKVHRNGQLVTDDWQVHRRAEEATLYFTPVTA